MFRLLQKKLKIKSLEGKYQKLLKKAYILSTTNRRESDSMTAEANEVLKEIELLEGNKLE